MTKFALVAFAALMVLSFSGCSKLSADESLNTGSNSQAASSQQETTSSTQSLGTASDSETSSSGQQVTTTTSSQNSQNIDDVQSQLDELENILKDLDDVSAEDLEIPDPE